MIWMNIFYMNWKRKKAMTKIDPNFKNKILKYGAKDFTACYNCGNCTAVCNLTEKDTTFPRKYIRYGLLGLKNEIIRSRELWMCYGCGDCSETCPRGADPASYMAALRRYTIAQYDITGITRWIFTRKYFALALTIFLAIALGFFLLTLKPESHVSRWIFQYMSYEIIHNLGIIVFAIVGITILVGVIRMILCLNKRENPKTGKKVNSVIKSFLFVFKELGTMHRQQICDSEDDSVWESQPWYKKPWFLHYSVMWGFIGLLVATTLDFIFKDPATKIWLPSRILGTIAGLFLMYGSTILIYYRIIKISKIYADTQWADMYFLIFLWLAGFTGFWLEVAVTMGLDTITNHIVFILHTVISMELVLLFAFSKFAHAVYRPLAIFFQYYRYGTVI